METIAEMVGLVGGPAVINAVGFFLLGLGVGLLVEQFFVRLERGARSKEARMLRIFNRIQQATRRTAELERRIRDNHAPPAGPWTAFEAEDDEPRARGRR